MSGGVASGGRATVDADRCALDQRSIGLLAAAQIAGEDAVVEKAGAEIEDALCEAQPLEPCFIRAIAIERLVERKHADLEPRARAHEEEETIVGMP